MFRQHELLLPLPKEALVDEKIPFLKPVKHFGPRRISMCFVFVFHRFTSGKIVALASFSSASDSPTCNFLAVFTEDMYLFQKVVARDPKRDHVSENLEDSGVGVGISTINTYIDH